MSTLAPWVRLEMGDEPDMAFCSIPTPEKALRSEIGLMTGRPKSILKAVSGLSDPFRYEVNAFEKSMLKCGECKQVAFEIMVGPTDKVEHQPLCLALLHMAIICLEANGGSKLLELNTFLKGLQV